MMYDRNIVRYDQIISVYVTESETDKRKFENFLFEFSLSFDIKSYALLSHTQIQLVFRKKTLMSRRPVRVMIVLSALCMFSGAGWIVVAQQPQTPGNPRSDAKKIDLTRFEKQIRDFEEADKNDPPQPGSILFTGSSSVRLWHKHLAKDFEGLTVLGRGFGGSTMPELVGYMDRLVLPYKPRAVVVYEGDNDLNAGRTIDELLEDYGKFNERLQRKLPGCRLFVLAIKPSPSRESIWGLAQEANARIAAWCRTEKNVTFIDVASPMLNDVGKPRDELFQRDRLHMNREGYKIWLDTIKPHLAAFATPQSANRN